MASDPTSLLQSQTALLSSTAVTAVHTATNPVTTSLLAVTGWLPDALLLLLFLEINLEAI